MWKDIKKYEYINIIINTSFIDCILTYLLSCTAFSIEVHKPLHRIRFAAYVLSCNQVEL